MTVTRPWRAPPAADLGCTIHVIGDVHATTTVATYTGRLIQTGWDSRRPASKCAAIVQIGDCINDNSNAGDPQTSTQAAEDAATDNWVNTWFLGAGLPPFYRVCGNHDIAAFLRSGQQWAARLGLASQNQAYYVGTFPHRMRLIIVGPDGVSPPFGGLAAITLTTSTVQWLDAQLALDSTTPTWVACHAPLYPAAACLYTQAYGQTGDDLFAVLNQRANVVGWLSGHTHMPFTDPRCELVVSLASGRKIARIDASCLASRTGTASDTSADSPFWREYSVGPWASPFVTYYPNPKRVEVRWRSHRSKRWGAQGKESVVVLPLT